MGRSRWIAAATVPAATLNLAHVLLVTGGPEQASELSAPVAGHDAAGEPGG
jgi:hypothetical protein